ncbi:isopeptide-forming domain-containing fimbrial protein [Parahaliea mediterranea]|uniref:isopeptide-forming domain-containing fimbrial protein n=1 Tax=Parahaliea mediterranea TaxID=651086 RepID=UPI000E2F6D5A|nr:isopeptide-forming domain-containing fimbrial protein [Parahaliea mediterranea]
MKFLCQSQKCTGNTIQFFWLVAFSLLIAGPLARAQDPALNVDGLPADVLIGEQVCSEFNFRNVDTTAGFGPYLVVVLDAGLVNTQWAFLDVLPIVETLGTFGVDDPITDPLSGEPLAGNPGATAHLVRYPVGYVAPASADFPMRMCSQVAPGSAIGSPLAVTVIPGFEYGDTATGESGAVLDTAEAINTGVTPLLARLEKQNSTPAAERTPGPDFPFDYQWHVDVSDQVVLQAVSLSDLLPPELQWTGGAITISASPGSSCRLDNTPNPPGGGPGGEVRVVCDALVGSAGTEDLQVTVPVYIADVLDEQIDDARPITNNLSMNYNYGGASFNSTASDTLQAAHAVVQKTVLGAPLPGTTLTYSLPFQISNYVTEADAFELTDILPDGLIFVDTLDLTINGAAVAITEVQAAGPGPGETLLSWDVAAALGAPLTGGTIGELRYRATVASAYANGDPINSSDTLTNNAELGYHLIQGGSGSDGATAAVNIPENSANKVLTSPAGPGELNPGQQVTFRLSMSIPAGNSDNVVMIDNFPLPVLSVSMSPPAVVVPAEPGIYQPPVAPVVTVDASTNSLIIEFGDVDADVDTLLAVDVTMTVSDAPYADNLYLTNIMQATYENSEGLVSDQVIAELIRVGAPDLVLTKGVIAADNSAAVLSPPYTGPVGSVLADSDVERVDAGDTLTFAVTVENIGGQPAYNVLITDPAVAGLNCAATPDSVRNGDGQALAYSGDLPGGITLVDPLPANDDTPTGGGAPFGADTAIVQFQCELAGTVEPQQQIDNTASVTWTGTPTGTRPFPAQSDSARITVDTPSIQKSIAQITPGYAGVLNRAQIGELVTYAVSVRIPEGRTRDVALVDTLDAGLAFVDVLSIDASAGLSTAAHGTDFSSFIATASIQSQGGGATAADRRLVIDFGELTNADDNNATAEVLTVRYRVRLLNAALNTEGERVRNRADWQWRDTLGRVQRVRARAGQLIVTEPDLRIEKVVTPDQGDDMSTPQVTIVIQHGPGSSADAFDLSFEDILPVVGGETLMQLVPSSVLLTGECPGGIEATTDLIRSAPGSWPVFRRGDRCEISFTTDINDLTPAGTTLDNCAQVNWQSLAASDQPLPMPPSSALGVERTGDIGAAGEINDYRANSCDTFKIYDIGIAKTVIGSSEPHTDTIPGTPNETESLAIGELVTFELVLTVPESPVDALRVVDRMPATQVVLELVSTRQISHGADVFPEGGVQGDALVPVINAFVDTNGDGINDSVELDYGNVGRAINSITDEDDRIRIEVVAKVLDRAANRNNDRDQNTATVSYAVDASGTRNHRSDTYGVEVVEALLNIEKTAEQSEVEAGDIVNYRLRVVHANASRTDGMDVLLEDALPPELTLVPGTLTANRCSVAPDTLSETGNTISAGWARFPLDADCEIEFQAEVGVPALTGSVIPNTGELAWTSLPGEGDADDRPYTTSDQWDVVVSNPGLEKAITATSSEDTSFTPGEAVTDLTIGETVTFAITLTVPDGTTRAARVTDVLPSDARFLVTSSRVVSIGGDLSISEPLAIGDAASCLQSDPSYTDSCSWQLGDIVNQPDRRADPDAEDTIVFEVVATVIDDAENSGLPNVDDDVINLARLDSLNVTLLARARMAIVEPLLNIEKYTASGGDIQEVEVGQSHRFSLVVEHRAASTATARSLVIEDVLVADMLWGGNLSSDCPALQVNAPAENTNGTVTLRMDSLPLSLQRCEIAFDVSLAPTASVDAEFPNTVSLTWESHPGAGQPPSRPGRDEGAALLFTSSDAYVAKALYATALDDTGLAEYDAVLEDLAIGEVVEYRITAYLEEGMTPDLVITDVLQDDAGGALEFIAGDVVFMGNNLVTESNRPIASVSGNTLSLGFGPVTNNPDGVLDENDTLVYRLFARAPDVAANVAGNVLENAALLEHSAAGGGSHRADANVLADVVEPVLGLSKSFGALVDGVASIELVLENTGNAPAYDIRLTDDLDEGQWVAGSVVATQVPPGFELSESDDGAMVVTLAMTGNPDSPPAEQVLAPGESLSLVFEVVLREERDPADVYRIPNTGEATATSHPGVVVGERTYTSSDDDTLLLPGLEFVKSASTSSAIPGELITYTLTVTNSGEGALTDLVLRDTPESHAQLQPGSLVASNPMAVIESGNDAGDTEIVLRLSELGAGASLSVEYQVRVPLPYPDGSVATGIAQRLVNQALVDSAQTLERLSDDPATSAEGDATVVSVVADPILRLAKDDGVASSVPGATLTYALTFSNAGDQDASGVVLTEVVPAYTRFNASGSTAGWSCPNGAVAGSVCELVVSGGLGGGASGEAYFAVDIAPGLPAGVSQVENTARISEDGAEFEQPAGEPATATAGHVTPLSAMPGLWLNKDDGGITAFPGLVFSYELRYGNNGNQAVTGVVLTETVPPYTTFDRSASTPGWSCADGAGPGTQCTLAIGELAAEQSGTANFGVHLIVPLPLGVHDTTNTAVLSDDGSNPAGPQQATATDDTPLAAFPDLLVTKTANVRVPQRGDVVVYDVGYSNRGTQHASGVELRETVPEGTVFVAADSAPANWSCADGAPAGTQCVLEVGVLEVGVSASVPFAVKVVDIPASLEIRNIVSIRDDGTNGEGPKSGDEIATHTVRFSVAGIPVMDARMLALLALAMIALAAACQRRRAARKVG